MSDFWTVERLGAMQSLTPEGFLVVRGVPLARCGPQLYSAEEIPIRGDAAGRVIIDRLPQDVFDPAAIASLQGKAVCLDHPTDDVVPANYSSLAVGTVINPRRGQYTQSNLLLGDLLIHDPAAIEAIRDRDVREISVGYRATYRETGVGRGRQTDIIANHVALVEDGRCGPICRIGDKAFFSTRDQQMDNLGPGGSQLRPFRLPRSAGAPSRDEGAGQSQGTTGSAGGGAPRRPDRPPTPPSLRSGAFTTDEEEQRLASSYFAPSPERDGSRYAAARAQAEADGDIIEGANKLQKFGERLQGNDQEEEPGLGEVIATMDPPPEGCVYRLQMQEDGSIAVLIVEDDGSDMNQNDATYRHSLGDAANTKFFRRLNGIHRRRWSRTRDWNSTQQSTLFRHKALTPGQRLQLMGPNSWGTFDLVLWGRTFDLTGPVPPGSGSGQKPNPGAPWKGAQAYSAAPGSRPGELDIHELDTRIDSSRTGDRRMTESQQLRSMNRAAAAFWRRSA